MDDFTVFFFILLIGVVISYFCLLKYEKERWLNDSYTAAIIISSSAIGIFFIICFIWNKQKKNFYKWRNFLMFTGVFLVIVSGLASAICMLDTLFSSRLMEAKNIYNQNQALQSYNEDILNQELNRRFENFWNIKSYRKGDSYNTLEDLMKHDTDFFNKLQEKSETGNGVAQGILGEYYFSLGIHQIIESKNDYNRIINESKYE